MYIVIFKAEVAKLDDDYFQTAKRMRSLAFEKYGCLDFKSLSENGHEIAVSYWPDEAAIAAWKNDPEHRQAQQKGREKWYYNYQVEIAEVKHAYTS
jgi:heme-degrading monooxygenase HmoA